MEEEKLRGGLRVDEPAGVRGWDKKQGRDGKK